MTFLLFDQNKTNSVGVETKQFTKSGNEHHSPISRIKMFAGLGPAKFKQQVIQTEQYKVRENPQVSRTIIALHLKSLRFSSKNCWSEFNADFFPILEISPKK